MNLDNFKHVPKVWGDEYWLVNNEKYCAKLLYIKPGFQCSLHCHIQKKETFIILDGGVNLELAEFKLATEHGGKSYNITETVQLVPGESYTLEPGTYHRFSSYTDDSAVVLEISSTHSDEDVVRLEDSRPL